MKLERSDLQLETIVSRISADELDLQPDFQRGEIWDLKRRQRLIDTILREWYVPAVHIVVEEDGGEVVLDGHQRLAAIRDFFGGKFKVDGSIEPHDEAIHQLDGLRYAALPDEVRRRVNRFVLPIITLDRFRPQEPNELFFRLNQAYNLTPPEKRNALHGKARDQVKELVNELESLGLLSSSMIGFTNARLAYDDIIARTCVAIEIGNLRQHINNTVVENFYRDLPFSLSTVDHVRRSGQELLAQISQVGSRVKFNKGTLQTWLIYCFWAPVEIGPLPAGLLAEFEIDRNLVKRGDRPASSVPDVDALAEILRLYDDRASYRVTDVSSVLIRDLAVHLFSELRFRARSYRDSGDLLDRLAAEPDAAQNLVMEYLEREQWGAPLVSTGPM